MTCTLIAGPGARRAAGLVSDLSKLGPTLLQEDPLALTAQRLCERNISSLVYLPDPGHWHGMRSEAHALRGLLEACTQAGVSKVLVLSCHRVYGASSQHSLFLPESTPLSTSEQCPAVRDLLAIDQVATRQIGVGSTRVVVLRPVYVLGGSLGSSLEPYFSAKFVPSVFGFDPMVQLIHASDLQRAIALALRQPALEGVYNVTGTGTLPLSVIARERGIERTRLLGGLGLKLNAWAVRAGLSAMPNTALPFLTHVLSVDGSRFARVTGYAPRIPLVSMVSGDRVPYSQSTGASSHLSVSQEGAYATDVA